MNEQELQELALKYPKYFDITTEIPKALVSRESRCYYDSTEQQENDVWAEIQRFSDKSTFGIFGDGGEIIYYGEGEFPRFRHFIKVWVIIDGKERERDIIISEGLITEKQLKHTKRLFRSQTPFLEVIAQFV